MPSKKIIPFQKIIDAKIDFLAGSTISEVSKKHGISPAILEDRFARIDAIQASNLPTLTTEQKIISKALSAHLKPIKERLSTRSLDIIDKADELVLNKLISEPEEIDVKSAVKVSEVYSNRLARLTGIEEDPTAGKPADKTVVNNIVNNIFSRLIPTEKITQTDEITQTEKQPLDTIEGEMV